MSEHIEAMDADLTALLKRGAPQPVAPPGAEERLFARLAGSIPDLGPPDGGGGGGGGAGAGGVAAGATPAAKIVLAVAGVLGTGAAIVAVALAVTRTAGESPNPAATSPSAAVAAASPQPTASVTTVRGVSIDDLPSAPSSVARPAKSATASVPASGEPIVDRVAEERALVDDARKALARGDASTSLESIRAHERGFPSGTLVEEREALAVKTLVALGRGAEARARAERFRATYPSSLFLPSVESAVGR